MLTHSPTIGRPFLRGGRTRNCHAACRTALARCEPRGDWSSSTQSSTRFSGIGLAGDQPEAVGRIPRQITAELGVGRMARPFGGVEHFAVRPPADRLAVAGAPDAALGQIGNVCRGHVILAQFDPGLVLCGGAGGGDRRLGREHDRRRLRSWLARSDLRALGFAPWSALGRCCGSPESGRRSAPAAF